MITTFQNFLNEGKEAGERRGAVIRPLDGCRTMRWIDGRNPCARTGSSARGLPIFSVMATVVFGLMIRRCLYSGSSLPHTSPLPASDPCRACRLRRSASTVRNVPMITSENKVVRVPSA